jgi:hypothetical protein
MDPTLVLVLRLALFAFVFAGAVQVARRYRGGPQRTAPRQGPWAGWVRAGRWISSGGLLLIVLGIVTSAPARVVLAGMAAALTGFVVFIVARLGSYASARRGG